MNESRAVEYCRAVWRRLRFRPFAAILLALTGCAPWPDRIVEDEIRSLLEQPSIDRLSEYIDRYKDDENRRQLVDRVLAEREHRCEMVGILFEGKKKARQNLIRLERSYGRSCPWVVKSFAEAVAEAGVQSEPVTEAAGTELSEEEVQPQPREERPVAILDSAQSEVKEAAAMDECRTLFKIRNFKEALGACVEPAEAGDEEAQFFLGEMFLTLGEQGRAFEWTRRSARQGYAKAQAELGRRLLSGEGVPVDAKQGERWLRKAAVQEEAGAQSLLGRLYSDGTQMAPRPKEALKWLDSAARNGNADAQYALGNHYLIGELVSKNVKNAEKWFLQAARQGNLKAQLELAMMHRQGVGGAAPDLEQAYIWYGLAAKSGDAAAARLQAEVAARLSAEQRTQCESAIERLEAQLIRR